MARKMPYGFYFDPNGRKRTYGGMKPVAKPEHVKSEAVPPVNPGRTGTRGKR